MAVRKLYEDPPEVAQHSVRLTPTESAGNRELTDIASVRQFMQKSTSEKLQDDDLEILIYQASEAIGRYTNREFIPFNSATRSFEYTFADCFDVLDLAPYEIRTLTSALLDPETEGGKALTNLQYRLRPYPSRDGTFFSLRLNELPLPKPAISTAKVPNEFPFFTRRIDLTGNWGMVEVPAEIQHYANLTVESWVHLRRDGGIPIGEAGGEGPLLRAEDLPPAVRWGLRKWMRPEALI